MWSDLEWFGSVRFSAYSAICPMSISSTSAAFNHHDEALLKSYSRDDPLYSPSDPLGDLHSFVILNPIS